MPHFLYRFAFTADTVKNMVAKPQDRREAAGRVFAAHGGTMRDYYWTMGEFDGLAICEFPDSASAVAVSMTVAASGAFTRFETAPLFTMEEALGALETARKAAGSYQAPGR